MQNAFNQNTSENQDPLGAPEADLSAYYSGADDPQIEVDIRTLEAHITDFVDQYKGNMANLDAQDLADMFEAYDDIAALISKVMTYGYLLSAKNVEKYNSFHSRLEERFSPLYQSLAFFSIELNELPEADLAQKIAGNPALARYQSTITDTRKGKPYQLGLDQEELLSALDPAGVGQWHSLFDKMEAAAEFKFENPVTGQTETLTQGGILNHMTGTNREIRAAAYECFKANLKSELMYKAHIMNAITLEKSIMDAQRKYATSMSARNASNNIEDEVVDALVESVTNAYGNVSHRYFEIKRGELGLDKLQPYDRVSPISEGVEYTPIPFEEARKIVLDSFRSFSETMADTAQTYFDNGWIDARPTSGKDQGAFNHPGSILAHPVVYSNYHGTPRDVETVAHELGHATHSSLAAKATQSQLLADYPLTVAETASVFGEKLVFERLLAAETDPTKRKDMLASKMEDTISTVFRQIAFLNFEKEVHARRKDGELSESDLNEIFLQTQKDSLGPAFDLDDEYGMLWSYIPHIVHTPFYFYSYAFGDCLVNAIYQKYVEAEDKADFEEKFLDILKAGGTKHHSELLAPLGIDLADPSFWENAMKVIEKDLDRLEEAIAAEKALKATPEQDNSPSA